MTKPGETQEEKANWT